MVGDGLYSHHELHVCRIVRINNLIDAFETSIRHSRVNLINTNPVETAQSKGVLYRPHFEISY